MTNFQSLVVVDRGSETQPQVVENLNKLRSEGGSLSLRVMYITDGYDVLHNSTLMD